MGDLYFRDFEIFNLAKLVKQGWRMLQQLDSLPAKLFKQKYFPHKDFLEATLGSIPSYLKNSHCWTIFT